MALLDFAIIGAGAGGEAAAFAALKRGQTVAIVDRELFGGSCAFWACLPSKSLLHSAERHRRGTYSWEEASARRDYMINRENRDWPDDTNHVKELEKAGAHVYRGTARIAGPRMVEVRESENGGAAGSSPASGVSRGSTSGIRRIEARTIVVATGSRPSMPPIVGLAETEPWTNREASSTRELPRSLVVLGGGATGVELASAFALFGVDVALVHSHDRLLDHDHPRNSEAAARILRDNGVELRLGTRAARVRPHAGSGENHVVELTDGGVVEGERILVALGRDTSLENLGLESINVDPRSVPRDGRLRIADGLYVIGDPAGPELFTHVSHYQGNLAVRMAMGSRVEPDYRAIPRAVYLDPEIASVGLTASQARDRGVDAFELSADFATTARGYEVEAAFGHLAIVVDRASRTLVGGSVVAPDASAAIHEIVLAIQARTPIDTLAGVIHAFPSTPRAFDGLFATAAEQLGVSRVPA